MTIAIIHIRVYRWFESGTDQTHRMSLTRDKEREVETVVFIRYGHDFTLMNINRREV